MAYPKDGGGLIGSLGNLKNDVLAQRTVGVTRAAELLGVSTTTVYRLIECGDLVAYRLKNPGWYKITLDSVERLRGQIGRQVRQEVPPGGSN